MTQKNKFIPPECVGKQCLDSTKLSATKRLAWFGLVYPKMRLADGSACIRTRFLLCGDVISNLVTRDRRRSGRPRVTSLRQDTYIRVTHLRNRLQTAALTARSIPGLRNISLRTVRNCLRERNIRPRRPAIHLVLQRRHHVARLAWCRAHLRFTRQDWARILFSDESSFHLDSSDGRSRVYRRVGERYQDNCCWTSSLWRGQYNGMGRNNRKRKNASCGH